MPSPFSQIGAAFGASANVSVTGDPSVGQTLTAELGVWEGSTAFTYQWRRDGVDISGETAKTYTVVEADEGASITCVSTAGGVSVTSSARSVQAVAVQPIAPVFDSTPITSATEGDLFSYAITVSDADSATLTITATTKPDWLALTDNNDNTATLTGTPDAGDIGDNAVTLEVSDGSLTETQSFTISVVAAAVANQAPTALSIPDQSVTVNELFSLDVAQYFSDPDGDTLTYSTTSTLPAGITLSGSVLSGTPTNVETQTIIIRATDPDGALVDSAGFEIDVIAAAVNAAPVFDSTPVTTATENTLYSYTVAVSDPDGVALGISAPTLPEWMTFEDNFNNTATLSGTPLTGDIGNASVVLAVSDGELSATQSFDITVNAVPESLPFTLNDLVTEFWIEGDSLLDASGQGRNGVVNDNGPTPASTTFGSNAVSAFDFDQTRINLTGLPSSRTLTYGLVYQQTGADTTISAWGDTLSFIPMAQQGSTSLAICRIDGSDDQTGRKLLFDGELVQSVSTRNDVYNKIKSTSLLLVTVPPDTPATFLGQGAQTTWRFNGIVASAFVISGELTDDQIEGIQGYCAHAYGFSLPAGHRFENDAPLLSDINTSSESAPEVLADQELIIGIPYSFDFSSEFNETGLTYSLSTAAPEGISLSGSVLSGTPTSKGETTVVVRAEDSNQEYVSSIAFKASTIYNERFIVNTIFEHMVAVGDSLTIDLASYFLDLDGDAITFSTQSTLTSGFSLIGNEITGTATAEDSKLLEVKGTDPDGAFEEFDNFRITAINPVAYTPSASTVDTSWSINDMTYAGGFRVSGSQHGNSSASRAGFSRGAFTVSESGNTIFLAGDDAENRVGEMQIPTIVNTTDISQMNVGGIVQDFEVLNDPGGRFDTGIQAFFAVTGMLAIDGKLIVNYYSWYDANALEADTTAVFQDSANLDTSAIVGPFQMNGAARSGGWISPIPDDLQTNLGGTHISGWSQGSISGRLSNGPSAYIWDAQSDAADKTAGAVIPASEALNYPLQNVLHKKETYGTIYNSSISANQHVLLNNDGRNDLWTQLSGAGYGFIIPNTDTYMTVGHSGGHSSGVGYKWEYPDGHSSSGHSAKDPLDVDNYYWLWNVNDLKAALDGTVSPYDIEPYDYGPLDTAGSKAKLVGGSFDPATGRLYVSLRFGDDISATSPPLFLVYDINPPA